MPEFDHPAPQEQLRILSSSVALDEYALRRARDLASLQPRGDYTIDQLPTIPANLAASDEFPIWRNGQTYKASVAQLERTPIIINPVWFNVKDYGAIGDGAHDDTAAFADCFAAASSSIPQTPATYATATLQVGTWTAASGSVSVQINLNGTLGTATVAYNQQPSDLATALASLVNTNITLSSVASAVGNSPSPGMVSMTALQPGAVGNNNLFSVLPSATAGPSFAPSSQPQSSTNFDGGNDAGTGAGGAIIYMPAGLYNLATLNDSTLAINVSNVYIQGGQVNATHLIVPPDVAVFTWNAVTGAGIRDVNIKYSSGSLAKSAVTFNNCSYVELIDVTIANFFTAVTLLDGGTSMFTRCALHGWDDGMGNGSLAGILFDGVKFLGPQGSFILQTHIGGGRGATMDGILARRGGAIIAVECGFLRCHHGINICPVNAKVNNCNFTSMNIDAASNVPCIVQPGAGGQAIKLHFTDFYTKTAGSRGFVFLPSDDTGIIQSVSITGAIIYSCRGDGLHIESTTAATVSGFPQVYDFNIVGGVFSGNGNGNSKTAGISINGPVERVTINGADCNGKVFDSPIQQGNGIYLDDAGISKPLHISIMGCNVRDNINNGIRTGPSQDFSMVDPGDYIANNPGFNPVGDLSAIQPSVPASAVDKQNPFGMPVQVYIHGGTVTNIRVKGNNGNLCTTGLTSGSFTLSPGASISTVNTGAPSWTWGGL